MSNAIKILPHYTYDDYVKWEGKWEVIEGVPYAMSPSPAPRHQIVANNLGAEFRMQLKTCKKCQVSQPVDYLVAEDNVLQPDLLIICKPITKKFLDFPPVLVAEILSPSTALKDRHSKYSIYESQGIRYYIIVDPDKVEAEVYVLTDGKYQLMKQGKDFSFTFELEECRAEIAFKEIW
jgi:Uma2 family endonuclease